MVESDYVLTTIRTEASTISICIIALWFLTCVLWRCFVLMPRRDVLSWRGRPFACQASVKKKIETVKRIKVKFGGRVPIIYPDRFFLQNYACLAVLDSVSRAHEIEIRPSFRPPFVSQLSTYPTDFF